MANMDDQLRKRLEARLNAPPPPAIERLRTFLASYVASGDREMLKSAAKTRPGSILDGAEAIEEVLQGPLEPGSLYHIVSYDGNRRLAQQTDEAAAAWLAQLAADLREWLGEPPLSAL